MRFLPPQEYLEAQSQKLRRLLGTKLPTTGVIKKVMLPACLDPKTNRGKYSVTHEVPRMEIDLRGILGERHYGETIVSGPRTAELYENGSVIRNNRQIMAVSSRDCVALSERLGVAVTPELLGANLLIDQVGGEDYSLSDLPQDLYMSIVPSGQGLPRPPLAVLARYTEQWGCGITGLSIAEEYGRPDLKPIFKQNSKMNRGLVFRIDYPALKPAVIEPGQKVFFLYTDGATP